jgi:hypothetical protein
MSFQAGGQVPTGPPICHPWPNGSMIGPTRQPSAATAHSSRLSRYVKLTTLEEAEGPAMHNWIEQAGRVPGWK